MPGVLYYGNGDPKQVFTDILRSPPACICIDCETISLKDRTPLGFSIALSPNRAFYFDLRPNPLPELALLKPLLGNPKVRKIFHNCMFDLDVFPLIPICGEMMESSNIWDTNVAARLLGRPFTRLTDLAWEVGLAADAADELLEKGKDMTSLDPMLLAKKCQNDARVTFALYEKFSPLIEAQYRQYFAVEMAVIPQLISMSLQGLKVDQRLRQEFEDKIGKEVAFYGKILTDAGIVNPNSDQQIGYILAKRGNFLPFTKSRKRLSVRKEVLEFVDDPLAQAAIEYNRLSQAMSTYILPLKGQDRAYTSFNLDAVVGRVSSSNINMQNIPTYPTNIRNMYLPDSGTFTIGDYSQEHLYILKEFSGDREMKRVYEEGYLDGDIHQYTASQMGISRKLAKTINYAIIYGATAQTIMEQSKIRDLRRCSHLLDGWFDTFRGAAYWIKEAQRAGLSSGWALPTLFGRTIRLPEESEDGMRRKSINYPILGSDGEVIKRAVLKSCELHLAPPVLRLIVHDSLNWDGDIEVQLEEFETIPGGEGSSCPGFRVPIKVSKVSRWE